MRADRLLAILLQLQTHARLTTRALAKRLEVSERTIHRDMNSLGSAGVPVVAERGARGGWTLMEGYRANLTGLTESELHALLATRPEKLLADLHLVLPKTNPELARQRIYIDVRGWNRSNEPLPHLPALQDALWRDRRVKMLYGDDPPHERVVDPLGLVARGSVWYLVAWKNGEPRSYRVSRVRAVTVLDETFARPDDFDLEKFWETAAERFREHLPRFDVVVRASAAAIDWLKRIVRYGAVDDVSGDRVTLHFDSEDVARIFLLGLGDQAEVLEPASLRDAVVAAARSIVSRGQSSTSCPAMNTASPVSLRTTEPQR